MTQTALATAINEKDAEGSGWVCGGLGSFKKPLTTYIGHDPKHPWCLNTEIPAIPICGFWVHNANLRVWALEEAAQAAVGKPKQIRSQPGAVRRAASSTSMSLARQMLTGLGIQRGFGVQQVSGWRLGFGLKSARRVTSLICLGLLSTNCEAIPNGAIINKLHLGCGCLKPSLFCGCWGLFRTSTTRAVSAAFFPTLGVGG